jgi:hypothetical protein
MDSVHDESSSCQFLFWCMEILDVFPVVLILCKEILDGLWPFHYYATKF